MLTPFTLAGAMAPVTLAGALAQQHGEALAGLEPERREALEDFVARRKAESGAPTDY